MERNGFTADHRAAFERHGTKRVYIAYDRDEAGDKAAAKLAAELIEMGIECYRVEFPKGMDANEYALKVTPAAKSLGVLLNRASWLGKGKRPARAGPVMVRGWPEIVAAVKEEQAAKEKMIERSGAGARLPIADHKCRPIEPTSRNVPPLAAEPAAAAIRLFRLTAVPPVGRAGRGARRGCVPALRRPRIPGARA